MMLVTAEHTESHVMKIMWSILILCIVGLSLQRSIILFMDDYFTSVWLPVLMK